jgi:hypothetical protein
MKTSIKWLCVGSFVLAGLISFLFSAMLFQGIVFDSFPSFSARIASFGYFLPAILGFPLFLLTIKVSKRFRLVLWLMVAIEFVLEFYREFHVFKAGGPQYVSLKEDFLEQTTAIPLLIVAVLVQFGTHFYQPSIDKYIVRKQGNQT